MKYNEVCVGRFLERPNRFIAHVEIDGKVCVCHVKNTGRCRELLIPGVEVYLERHHDENRKTQFSLIGVKKVETLINMDSQAPNKAVGEWLEKSGLFQQIDLIRPEKKYKNSRFDFYIEADGRKIFMEVKGVTLEENTIARFPDAPTARGVKHIEELCGCLEEGYEAYLLFVIQMKGITLFEPNVRTHKAFADALQIAQNKGVHILAYDCKITEDTMELDEPIPINLDEKNELSVLVDPLLGWYHGHKRVLPWREDKSAYRIWISEIMLQQTRVEAVKPYFERFTTTLPTMKDLAEVEEENLLKLWEGLGYYNRVRNMQKAAQKVMVDYEGVLPADYETLLKLPGIGPYTAGAVASIAYDIPVPAVDGNVLRVIMRVTGDTSDIMKQSVKTEVEKRLLKIIPKTKAGDFNQALMELGATVCSPNGAPKCEECPWRCLCQGKKQGIEQTLPRKTKNKARRLEKKTILIIQDGTKVAIQKRPMKGLLAGLYEFPNVEGELEEKEVAAWMKEQDFFPIRIEKLEPSKHIFSHIEWHMVAYMIQVEKLELPRKGNFLFTEYETTEEHYPIPAAFAAYTKYLNIRLGNEKYEGGWQKP